MREAKDRAGKWLIDHYGDSILHLAGIRGFERWRSVQAQVVQQSRIPDGLVEVFFPGVNEPDLVLLEIYAYPRNDISDDVLRDLALIFLDRGKIPEVITIILQPKGKVQVPGWVEKKSRMETTGLACRWQVVELWNVRAQDLLNAQEVGLIPWAILGKHDGPPQALLQQCKERIERQAPADLQLQLLAATQFLASLCYDDRDIQGILGGTNMAVEWTDFPLVQNYINRKTMQVSQKHILDVLDARFENVPEELAALVRTITEEKNLDTLHHFALTCPSLGTFRAHLLEQSASTN